jgi:antitoxin YefM
MPVLVQLVEQARHPMKVVTDSHAHNALKSVLDGVVQDADGTLISRRDAQGDAVVMLLGYYNSRMETLHLLSTPANARHWHGRSGKIRLDNPRREIGLATAVDHACNSLCARTPERRISTGTR